ncbi:MAG: DUF6020 family protein, partial [Bifidobacteriaceae bacterium]|nr:DUF6020 family protein [Bifidobacteriaceae bacterium]
MTTSMTSGRALKTAAVRMVRSRLTWGLGFAASAATMIGVTITSAGAVPWTKAWFYLLIVALTPVFAAVAGLARYLVERPRSKPLPVWRNRPRAFFFDWVAIWVCWIPVWMSGWPGFWCYDAAPAYASFKSRSITNGMPPLHTYLSNGFQSVVADWTGIENYGIAAFIGLQSLVVAATFAYALRRLRAWGVARSVRWGALAYFALFPTISLFSLTSARNTGFSTVVLALAVCLVDALKQAPRPRGKQWWRWCLVAVLALAVVALRRDATYVLIMFTVAAVFCYRPARKALAVCFVSATIAGLLLDPVLYKAVMGVHEASSVALYSVPLQQVGRVYALRPDSLTPEQKQLIESFIVPEQLVKYRPQLADAMLSGANLAGRLEPDTNRFLKLWAEIGAKNPDVYLDALVANTVQGWAPGAIIDAYSSAGMDPTPREAGTSYFSYSTQLPGTAVPKGPQFVRDFYWDFSWRSQAAFRIPVVSWAWSPGTYLWLFAFALALTAAGVRRHRHSAFLPVSLLLIATCVPVFFGPTMVVRYFLQLFYCAPLVAAFVVDPRVYRLPRPHTTRAPRGPDDAPE